MVKTMQPVMHTHLEGKPVLTSTHFRRYEVPILVLLILLSRMPQLTSDLLLLDGDESIVGLMAKHLYEGKELPLYFYGQSYGFSFIEVLAIVPFYFLFDVSDVSVKLAMLFLWTLGVIFFYKALKRINPRGSLAPFLLTLVFVFAPAWAVWSMKARGGYITSFFLSSLLTYIVFDERKGAACYAVLGILLVVIYESQPLWLPGLLPILWYGLYRRGSNGWLVFYLLGGIVLASLMFYLLKKDLPNVWSPEGIGLTSNFLDKVKEIPWHVFIHMTGSHEYFDWIDVGFATSTLAVLYTGLILLGVLFSAYLLVKRSDTLLLRASASSVMFSLAYLLFCHRIAPRYLLPITGFSFLMFSEIINKIKNTHGLGVFCLALIAFGVVSLNTFGNFEPKWQSGQHIKQLAEYFDKNNIHFVFSRWGFLQWQVMFYSKEKIIARSVPRVDRYPTYISKVDHAFGSGSDTAVLDFSYHVPLAMADRKRLVANNTYLVHLNPSKAELVGYGFELP